MLKYYNFFLDNLDMQKETYDFLLTRGEDIIHKHEEKLNELIAKLYRVNCDTKLVKSELLTLAEKSACAIETLNFVFSAVATRELKNDFLRANLSEELFWAIARDFNNKLLECKNVNKVFGIMTGSFEWYSILFRMDLFQLGRLQFERVHLPFDLTCADKNFKRGDLAFSVHIPSSGSFARELRLESYRIAHKFFAEETNGGDILFVCNSWLLYPENRKIFPPHLNVFDFLNEWKIIESHTSDVFNNAWRVFGKNYESGKMPAETTQQKALINWIENGGKTGVAYGAMVFDGENILL